ncbi:MAG: hypothetical protein E6G97_11955 [Alphaproteobacteria bacterium]|nr:MAG: hypothetical protein E6G97_11955 [Alphaproteobacteria bacterium]
MAMAADAVPRMMRAAMRLRAVMDRMVEMPVGTRVCSGGREGDQASGCNEGSDKFLLHHHS